MNGVIILLWNIITGRSTVLVKIGGLRNLEYLGINLDQKIVHDLSRLVVYIDILQNFQ